MTSRSEKIYDDYNAKVFIMLRDDYGIGEIRRLDKTSPNYDRFVEAVKGIIDCGLDRAWGFDIEFNGDYSAFRKLPLI